MKPRFCFYLILSGIILLTSCNSCSNDSAANEIVKVGFTEYGTNMISWFELFPDMEIVKFTDENKPMFGYSSNLIVTEDAYYLIEIYKPYGVHRYDKNGKYLNSIELVVTDDSGNTVGEHFPSESLLMPSLYAFTKLGDNLYFCPSEGDEIYRLEDGKPEV